MKTTLVLAMTADGKISDTTKSPPTFSSERDSAHLEEQIALADLILVGSGTLGDGGSVVLVQNPGLIQARIDRGQPTQPPQLIASRSGKIDAELPFFSQPIAIADGKPFERWLLTTNKGAKDWQNRDSFSKVLVCETADGKDIDWQLVKSQLAKLNIKNLCFLGGSELAASLFAVNFIDELWLTICPTIYGGSDAPSPVSGAGFTPDTAPKLTLLSVDRVEQELFLHYQVQK